MSYQVIARKWRPQTFEEVTGQEAITLTLRNAVEHERLHHAYLFSGARGVGKTTTARLLAKALNCRKTDKPNPTPCKPDDPDACVSCREIAEGRSIDVMEFDAASNTQVDKIRDLIIENINIAPARDRFKVFIIDEVHMLSTSSFNALLKTLEEPPPNVVFIMATTELHKVPDTILSRTQEFEFRTIPVAKIFERLKFIAVEERINISDEALREIARSGEGSMRDAQSNFDQVISFSGEQIEIEDIIKALGLASSEMLTRVIKAVYEKQPKEILAVIDELISRGQDLRNFCRDMLSFLRDLLVSKIAGDAENLLESASISREELAKYAAQFSEADLIRFFNSLSDTAEKLRNATQERYILEIGLVKLVEIGRITSVEKILERLAKLESSLGGISELAQTPDTRHNLPAISPVEEKKTLKVDISKEEVPFDVRESHNVVFAPSVNIQNTSVTVVADVPEVQAVAKNSPIIESIPANSENVSVKKPQLIDEDFINNVQVKLPPISSEELEHIEDNWLDNAFEEKLKRAGDNLFTIEFADEIVVRALGSNSLQSASSSLSISNGNGTAAAPAKSPIDSVLAPPVFEEDESPGEIIELSENPDQEELMRFAANHPSVKKVLRIFRGKIIGVEKTK